MKLYLRHPYDDPHAQSDIRPGFTRCGLPIAGARAITENQALVFLDNRRCHGCLPNHSATEGQKRRG